MAFGSNLPKCCSQMTCISDLPLDLRRPVARVQLSTDLDRIQCASLRAAFTVYVRQLQTTELPRLNFATSAVLSNIARVQRACAWCGLPTGCFCDDCRVPRAHICTSCNRRFDGRCPWHNHPQALALKWQYL